MIFKRSPKTPLFISKHSFIGKHSISRRLLWKTIWKFHDLIIWCLASSSSQGHGTSKGPNHSFPNIWSFLKFRLGIWDSPLHARNQWRQAKQTAQLFGSQGIAFRWLVVQPQLILFLMIWAWMSLSFWFYCAYAHCAPLSAHSTPSDLRKFRLLLS